MCATTVQLIHFAKADIVQYLQGAAVFFGCITVQIDNNIGNMYSMEILQGHILHDMSHGPGLQHMYMVDLSFTTSRRRLSPTCLNVCDNRSSQKVYIQKLVYHSYVCLISFLFSCNANRI